MSEKLITSHFTAVKTDRQTKDIKSKQTKATKTVDDKGAGSSSTAEDKDLETLRQFDLNVDYGPCIGITRLERWQRAAKHDLHPPQQVMDLIQAHRDNSKYTECVWSDYSI